MRPGLGILGGASHLSAVNPANTTEFPPLIGWLSFLLPAIHFLPKSEGLEYSVLVHHQI